MYSTVRLTLQGMLSQANLGFPIAWQDVEFQRPTQGTWLAHQILRSNASRYASLGSNRMTRRHGIIQVNINTPAGLGNTAAEQIAETISDIYTGQVLSGLRDSITFQPSGLVHAGTRDGFAVSLLSVPFQADSWEMGIYAHSNFGSRASFTGAQDGDNATFTVNNLAEGVALQVFIDGVYQSPIFYTRLDNQVTLTFVPQPADNLQFFVNVPLNLQRAAFTGAQDGDNTVFNVPSIQDPDNMQVFFNGILLNGLQYSVVDKQVTLLFAPTSNDSLEFFTW